jgi:hypothetical protein
MLYLIFIPSKALPATYTRGRPAFTTGPETRPKKLNELLHHITFSGL